MLAFLNIGPPELILIAVVAVLVFGKDLPQAASKAYLHFRKLRSAVDDLRRDSGIDRELRNIERSVREAEWEARRPDPPPPTPASVPRASLPGANAPGVSGSSASAPNASGPSDSASAAAEASAPAAERGGEPPHAPTDAAS